MKKALLIAVVLALMVPSFAFASTNEEQISLLWKEVKALQAKLDALIERMDTVKTVDKEDPAKTLEGQTTDTCFRLEVGSKKSGCSALGG